MKIHTVLTLCMMINTSIWAQQNTAHTLAYDESNSGTPEATLQDVEWIAGHWRGEAFVVHLQEKIFSAIAVALYSLTCPSSNSTSYIIEFNSGLS